MKRLFGENDQLESCLLARRARVGVPDSPSREIRLEKRRFTFGELRRGSNEGSKEIIQTNRTMMTIFNF